MLGRDRPVCVSIGSSDCSGASGIQADLKTFFAHDCYCATAITAAMAQNFSGTRDIELLSANFVRSQLEAIAEELPISAVKVGLCPSVDTIRLVGRWLRERPDIPVVVDPEIADSHGVPLLQPEAIQALCTELLPRATVITPNHVQAARLTGQDECLGQEAMEEAARSLFKSFGCPTVVTGGGLTFAQSDVFVGMDGLCHFQDTPSPRRTVHGRGSTFSAAIAASLARGESLRESILNAKIYLAAAIAAAPSLGDIAGPLWHGVTPPSSPVIGHS